MGLSDMIAEFINAALKESEVYELQRGDIAQQFGCVPSQINYVISTRFSPEQGFIVESRRGGGGYIRIRRVSSSRADLLMHVVNSIGDSIDPASASALIGSLVAADALNPKDAGLISAAISEQALGEAPSAARQTVRAEILKRMFVFCAYHNQT